MTDENIEWITVWSNTRHRIYLDVDYRDNKRVKQLGARWDHQRKQWYYPGSELPPKLEKWRIGAAAQEGRQKIAERYRQILAANPPPYK